MTYFDKIATGLSFLSDNITGTMLHYYKQAFPRNFFKYEHVTTEKAISEIKKQLNKKDVNLIKNKPILVVEPTMDFTYDSPYDDTLKGERMYDNHSILNRFYTNKVFIDNERGIYLDYIFNEYKMNIRFDVFLETQMQYYDVFNIIKNSFRVEKPFYLHRKMEIALPNIYMEAIANENGYKIGTPAFLEYLNKYSVFPITYKIKKSSSRHQYFMFMESTFKLFFNKVSGSDGGRNGFDKDDFITSQDVEVVFKAPSIFYYISDEPYKITDIEVEISNEETVIPMFTLQIAEFPEEDPEGRKLQSNTLFKIDDKVERDITPLTDIISDRYIEVIEYCNAKNIELDDRINILLFKDDVQLAINKDFTYSFQDLELITTNIDTNGTYRIIVYIDFVFFNNILDNIRINEDKNLTVKDK